MYYFHFIIAFVAAPAVDIDGIREPVSGSLFYGNNISVISVYFSLFKFLVVFFEFHY